MIRPLTVLLCLSALCAHAGDVGSTHSATDTLCSESWYRSIEAKVPTGDGRGHGPDIGSDEWKSGVEFKLGIRGQSGLPARDTEAWCGYIDRYVRAGHSAGPSGRRSDGSNAARGPSFSCDGVTAGSIEAMICADADLAALDRELSRVYAAASGKVANEHPPRLGAEQRGWIKGRDDCWKSDDKRGCVEDEYRRRIAELQARYQLVASSGPVRFRCNGDRADEVVATFYHTSPPTLIAERGDSVSLMYLAPSASGSKYRGRNETLREHGGEAVITWGYGAPEMHCRKLPQGN